MKSRIRYCAMRTFSSSFVLQLNSTTMYTINWLVLTGLLTYEIVVSEFSAMSGDQALIMVKVSFTKHELFANFATTFEKKNNSSPLPWLRCHITSWYSMRFRMTHARNCYPFLVKYFPQVFPKLIFSFDYEILFQTSFPKVFNNLNGISVLRSALPEFKSVTNCYSARLKTVHTLHCYR